MFLNIVVLFVLIVVKAEDDIEIEEPVETMEDKIRILDDKWQNRMGLQVAYLRERIEKLENAISSLNDVMLSDWINVDKEHFKLFDRNLDWNEAQVFCRLRNAQLVNIDDPEKNKMMTDLLRNGDPSITEAWIALKAQTVMETKQNQYENFTKRGLLEGCTVVDVQGKWKIRPCTKAKPFICEKLNTMHI
ncbi:unnamed protein product [Bursaphelenchus okinawaensis]|uniref:C-type lectin domain-containing protein n=1 Tax=Bursaphelenchus okinawaensis TaxID=465554 RepID=A0A811K6A3_9BILA|nr:unnamed protein product [Bursaphelenchus okinawaensis]CAG9093775.1 unnamed protein product [Bursaphelenchus okinawaensis]